MTAMKKRDRVMAIFWILLGLMISIWSATFPFGKLKAPGPALLPLALGLILILLGGILFFQAIIRKGGTSPEALSPFIPVGAAFMRVAFTLGGLLLSIAFLEHLGFILTTFFLILFLMRAIEPQKWKLAVFYALVSALGSFILFQVFLKTPLPRGFLGF